MSAKKDITPINRTGRHAKLPGKSMRSSILSAQSRAHCIAEVNCGGRKLIPSIWKSLWKGDRQTRAGGSKMDR